MFNLKSFYYFMFLLLLKRSYSLYKVKVKTRSFIDMQGLNASNMVEEKGRVQVIMVRKEESAWLSI